MYSLSIINCNYLSGRPQYVRLQNCESDRVVSNTGAPQGTVFAPFFFTVYTTDFTYQTESCHLQKFSDDSAIVGCIKDGDEEEYRAVVVPTPTPTPTSRQWHPGALQLQGGGGYREQHQQHVSNGNHLLLRQASEEKSSHRVL
ncbi:hypothetical protein AAFF_G00336210 [Aldrovandia affinis]|uniref:Reverse transcriptase domain-containing protein n=1 Tax=Aldrovandia affinis TaxID=143900 RepID=A0AAD7R8M4_9TELE|nr:hypothetical protein AAFF_G00336210 [Aldrovandia affinis]